MEPALATLSVKKAVVGQFFHSILMVIGYLLRPFCNNSKRFSTKGRFMKSKHVIGLVSFLHAVAILAAQSTPSSSFTINNDGTATHKTTGLMWKRCSEGQTFRSNVCEGQATGFTQPQSESVFGAYAGYTDWRVPSISELASIVEYDKALYSGGAFINSDVFPNTPSSMSWSATKVSGRTTYTWRIDFSNGVSDSFSQGNTGGPLRLVRGRALSQSSASAADYIENGDGTVTHVSNGLTWKKCAEGQSYANGRCAGSATPYSAMQAGQLQSVFAGKSDWRLPKLEELLTIVEYASANPSVNQQLFPDVTSLSFWSGTLYPMPGFMRHVNFSTGQSFFSADSTYNYVRLVSGSLVNTSSGLVSEITGNKCVVSWLESVNPDLTMPPTQSWETLGPYTARYYSTTQAFIALSSINQHIYYLGPVTENKLIDLGPVSSWLAPSRCRP